MRRTALLALLSSTLASAAPHAVPRDLFTPTSARLITLCTRAQKTAADVTLDDLTRTIQQVKDGGVGALIYNAGGTYIRLQSSASTAYTLCANRVLHKGTRPHGAELAGLPVVISITGRVANLAQARSWRAFLVFLDRRGKELGRLKPARSSLGQGVGQAPDWKQACKDKTCTWTGQNTYSFTPTPAARKAFARSTSLRIVATLGHRVVTITLPLQRIGAE